MDRLRQIALQVRGVAAFMEAEVVATLRLNAEQRERMRGIEAELFSSRPFSRGRPGGGPPGRPGGPPGRPGGPPGKPRKRIDEQAMRLTVAKALAVLTPQQATKWKDMTGEAFKGAFTIPPPGPVCPPPGPR